MIHGIYLRNKPTKKWMLMSVVASAETASKNLEKLLTKAKLDGNNQAEGAIQSFESLFFIPETLSDIKPSKVLWN